MSQFEITPPLLNDLRQKAEACDSKEWVVNNPKKHDSDYPGISGVRTSDGYPVIHWSDHPHKGIYLESYAEYIAAASPAVMLALVAEVAKLKAESIEKDIQRAEGVLRMFRGEQQDFTGLFSEAELIAEGLDKPADVDGTTAGIWASFIERKQLECEQYRSLAK